MEINPIPENDLGYQEAPDNGLSPEQMAALDAKIESGEQSLQYFEEEQQQAEQPSTGGTEKPAPTSSAADTSQPEQQTQEPEQESGGFADLPNIIDDNPITGGTLGSRLGFSLGFGLTDAGVDLVNWGLRTALRNAPDAPQIPRFNAYDETWLNMTRLFGSVAIPQAKVAGMIKQAAGATSVGNAMNSTKLGRFGLDLTADLGSAVAVTQVSKEMESEANAGNLIQDNIPLPAFMDGFLEGWAIQPGDSPEKIKEKNRAEEFGMALIGPMIGYVLDAKGVVSSAKPIEITGDTELSEAWLKTNSPKPVTIDEDVVLSAKIKQDEALTEYGDYNMYKNEGDPNVPLRGVDNGVFDYKELGVRTVDDFGVVGASVDAAQIRANKGTTYGRIRNMISEGAVKYASDVPEATDEIVLGLAKTLKDADQYHATGSGWRIDFNEILEAGDDLVVDMIDPTMDASAIRRMLDPFIIKNEDGVEILSDSAFGIVKGATKRMIQDYTGMDIARAQSYLNTSLAGQASDLSEGIRLNAGGEGVKFAQEKIRDNLKLMMKLKGETNYYKNQRAGIEEMFRKGKNVKADVAAMRENFTIYQENLTQEIAEFGRDLDFMYREYPELGEVVGELLELTDGRQFTIGALNETMAKSFKRFDAFNADPEMPNLIGKAIRGNVFNSMLSSIETPVKALYGNLAGTVFEPFNMMAGAMTRGNLRSIQDYWMAYTAIDDTLGKAMKAFGKMFNMAAENHPSLKGATDLDFQIKQDNKIELLRKTAELEAERGNTGYATLVQLQTELLEMSRHPAMRFSSNLMTGMDGMTQATFANAEARFRAMDLMRETDGAVDPEQLAKIANQEYNKMFDADGILKDSAVQKASDEVALRLDNAMARAMKDLAKKHPVFNFLFPFPGSMSNFIKQFDDMAPVPFSAFQKDMNELMWHKTEYWANNPTKVRKALQARGYDVDSMTKQSQLATLTRLRDHVVGRKATTTVLMGLATGAVAHDRLTGDGFYDKQKQAARVANGNWKPRSVRVPDLINGGEVLVPWSNILPPGVENWLAAWITAVDNFDSLGEEGTENLQKKLMTVFAGALADDAGLSVIEPIVQILNGNTASFNRFAARQLNSTAPLAGARRDLSQLIDSGLMHVEQDIASILKNNNRILSPFKEEKPYITNPLDGTQPNNYNFLQRLINKVSPVKVHTGPSELGTFLNDIEYPSSMLFRTYQGIKLTGEEKASLQEIAAEQGIWTQGVKAAKELSDSRGTIASLKEAQARGMRSDEIALQDFDGIHAMIDQAKAAAEEAAFNALPPDVRIGIMDRIEEKEQNKLRSQMGNILEQTPTR